MPAIFPFDPAVADGSFPLPPIPSLKEQNLDLGAHEVAAYAFGATHVRDFLRPLGATAYKFGITGCRDAERRVEDCRRKQYGALLKRPGDPNDPGIMLDKGHEWFLVPFQEAWLNGMMLPEGLRIHEGIIRLTLPISVTVEMAERRLHAMIIDRCLNRYLDSPKGQERLRQAKYDPAARMHTRYTLMTSVPRVSLATEIYLIRPRAEFAAYVGLLGRLVRSLTADAKAADATAG